MIRTTSEAIMISALASSHIFHVNKASVSEFLSQANRPTSTITNKPIQESQMAHLKQPCLFPELGKPEPWNQSWLQIIFPWAPWASKMTHKLAAQKKNANTGTIHYLELVRGQQLPFQMILSCRYSEGRWKVQRTLAGVVLQCRLLPFLAGFFFFFFCRLCKSLPAAKQHCSAVFSLCCMYLTIGWFYIFNRSAIFH